MASYVCISDLILFVLNSVMGIMEIDNNNKIKNRAGRVVYDWFLYKTQHWNKMGFKAICVKSLPCNTCCIFSLHGFKK